VNGRIVPRVCDLLGVTAGELARELEITVGCLRSWNRRGPPRYGQLALAALVAKLDPKDWLSAQAIAKGPTGSRITEEEARSN